MAFTSAFFAMSDRMACLSWRRAASAIGASWVTNGANTRGAPEVAPALVALLLLFCAATPTLTATTMAARDSAVWGLTGMYMSSLELQFYYAGTDFLVA